MSKCRKCGEPVDWTVTKNGKKMPLVPGTSEPHFAICSKPEGWFTREFWIPREEIKNNVKTQPFLMQNLGRRKSFYRGTTPPWEFPEFIDCIE